MSPKAEMFHQQDTRTKVGDLFSCRDCGSLYEVYEFSRGAIAYKQAGYELPRRAPCHACARKEKINAFPDDSVLGETQYAHDPGVRCKFCFQEEML